MWQTSHVYCATLIYGLSKKKLNNEDYRQSDPKFAEFIQYRGNRQMFRQLNTWTQRKKCNCLQWIFLDVEVTVFFFTSL